MAHNHNFGKIWTFGRLLFRSLFTDEGQIWCAIADAQCMFTCQNLSLSVYSIALRWRKTHFCVFWTSAFSDIDSWRQSEKVEHRCTTTNLPLSNGIKSFLYSSAFMVKSGEQTLDVQKRDGQTKCDGQENRDRQTKLNAFRHPGGG